MTQPLSKEQLAEVREVDPGEWYAGPWTVEYVETSGDAYAHYVVKASDGQRVASLPDWAGPLAHFVAEARTAMPALLAEVDRLQAVEANARKLVSAWLRASAEHISVSNLDAVRDEPLIAGMQDGRANQYSDCANELRDVLDGEDPDGWEFGVSVQVAAVEAGESR